MKLLDFNNETRSWTFETDAILDGSFGPDRNRPLIVTLHRDGRLEMRPVRRKQSESICLKDVYRFAIRCRAGRSQLEKARDRKVKKEQLRERRRLDAMERRLRASAKAAMA